MNGPSRAAGHILIAEDEAELAGLLAQHLAALGHRVTSVRDGRSALQALRADPFDVALLDIVMPPPDGLEVLRALADDPDPPTVIVMTGQGNIDTSVQAMRLGAFAYVAKPYRMAELSVVVARALERQVLAHENATLREQVARAEGGFELLTQFAPLRAVYAAAVAAAAADEPIFIVGAPGTGKCSLARALHARSARSGRPFVQIDAGTLASEDGERVLFGDQSGGGPKVRAALATGGTVYLHDVLALSLRAQARLARAIRHARFRSAGASEDAMVRARIIAAATETFESAGARAHPELAAAFSGVRIELPPLRERAVDVPLLVNAFLGANTGTVPLQVHPDALAALEQYPWPGNVAELRAVLERARIIARDGVIRISDLALSGGNAQLELVEVERRHIAAVLEAEAWHQGRAAETLGISPKTLYRKMREYGLRRPTVRERA